MNMIAQILITQTEADSIPVLIQAFVAGLGAPVSLWGLVILIKFSRRGFKVADGQFTGGDS